MNPVIITDAWFDGTDLHTRGPYTLLTDHGRLTAILTGDLTLTESSLASHGHLDPVVRAGLVTPGLVDAHVHLSLNGSDFDASSRKAFLQLPVDAKFETARQQIERTLNAGITVVRDAGDAWGINDQLKREQAAADGVKLRILSAGSGLRRIKGYGSFIGHEVPPEALVAAVAARAGKVDALKILLTGIIDFEHLRMTSAPQFTAEQLKIVTAAARTQRLPTLAHCSGADGLTLALDAGIDCIEHGFFATTEHVQQMARQSTAWTPTFAPVHVHWKQPTLVGWSDAVVARLGELLAAHAQRLMQAHRLGVPVLAGSDAGSFGVPHGSGLIDELERLVDAGLSLQQALASATTLPRRLWGLPGASLHPGSELDIALFEGSQLNHPAALRRCIGVIQGQSIHMTQTGQLSLTTLS